MREPFKPVHLDFESGTFDGWSVKRLAAPHSAVIQSDVVRSGKRACRFELRPGDYISQGHRAELRDPYNVVWDEDGLVRLQHHDRGGLRPAGDDRLRVRAMA